MLPRSNLIAKNIFNPSSRNFSKTGYLEKPWHVYNDDETLGSKEKEGKNFSAAIFGETGEIGTATVLSTVFHGRFVTRHGSVIRYTGELDKAIKRGNNRESEPWGDYTAVFPSAPNEPSVHKCFWGRTRPRSPGVLGDAGMLAARGRIQWTIRLPSLANCVDSWIVFIRQDAASSRFDTWDGNTRATLEITVT